MASLAKPGGLSGRADEEPSYANHIRNQRAEGTYPRGLGIRKVVNIHGIRSDRALNHISGSAEAGVGVLVARAVSP